MSADEIFLFLQRPYIAVPIVLLAMAAFFFAGRRWAALYVGLMPFINWSFGAVQTLPIPEFVWLRVPLIVSENGADYLLAVPLGGGAFQPLAIVTGLVLVVRDFAQREMRHWVWGAMIAGLLLSMLTSWIVVVFASAAAFLISETVDWAVYTFSKRPLSQRVMVSSGFSAPLDQMVFIWLASQIPGQGGIFAWGTILTGIASKLLGAWIVSRILAARERPASTGQMNPA